MIFPLSIICIFASGILGFVFSYLYNEKIGWSLLIGFGFFVATLAIFCLFIVIILPIMGRHYAKTYDPHDKKRWFFMNDVARFSCFWLGVIPHVEGLEKIPENQTIVIYANHQSYLDMFIFYTILKKHHHATMYKEDITKYSLAAGMAKALGGVSIDRNNDKKAAISLIEIIKEVKSGVNFLIFPEGTRSKGVALHEYKAGSFKIVQKSGASMVVLALDGAYRKLLSFPLIPSPIYLKVVEVMSNEDTQKMSTHELAAHVEEITNNDLQQARSKHLYLRIPRKYRK